MCTVAARRAGNLVEQGVLSGHRDPMRLDDGQGAVDDHIGLSHPGRAPDRVRGIGRRRAPRRTDGFTSPAVLLGAGGAALGWGRADPMVALMITAAIVLVLRDAAREVCRWIMAAADPALDAAAETALDAVPGALEVGAVRLGWIGHRLRADSRSTSCGRRCRGPARPPGSG